MDRYPPIDAVGKDLKVGDWVRVCAVPEVDLPEDSRQAFASAVGKTFQIEAFNDLGCLELDLWPKVSLDTIWIEPYCVERARRYKKLSRAFQEKQAAAMAPPPPRYELKFKIVLRPGVSCEEFGLELIGYGTNGGFAAWPEDRRIEGSIYVDADEPDVQGKLEEGRRFALTSKAVERVDFEPVIEPA